MNETQAIAHVFKHHADAFKKLTSKQRAAVLNAMGACYQQGQQSRPDYNMPPTLDGDTSETLTPQAETLARIFADTLPLPDDIDAQCERYDQIAKMREAVMA